jgi:glyoxylase-like metal-dependent hydrolase (beta-lactamase superfamily II)
MRTLRCLVPSLLAAVSCFAQPAAPQYEIYALRYATVPSFPVSELVPGADPTHKIDIAMMVWLVRGGGHTILVDSGFYHQHYIKEWNVHDFVKPSEAIDRLGVKPEEVTDIIISHMHWDHAGGIDLFPKARIWIQKDEYHFYTGEAWQSKNDSDGIDPEDVLALVKANTEGRVSLVDGDAREIILGIACYIGGKHTYQSQYVGVNTKAGIVVLASDNVYLYENLEKHVPIAETLDASSNLRAQDRMRQLATSKLIIPGHDPAVMTKFPAVAPGIVRIE